MLDQGRLGWGLVGLGRHGRRFIAPAISQSTTGELVAVFSRDMERAEQFAKQYNCSSAYNSVNALVEDSRINAVYVCSPNHTHKEHVLRAASAGKHVLCEKPLAVNVEDCKTMIDACRRAGIKLGVGFHLRHNPVHIAARDALAAGAIGEPLFAEVQYLHATSGDEATYQSPAWRKDPSTMGGGRLVSVGGHAIDLIQFVLGRSITHVVAVGDKSWYVSQSENLVQVSMLLEGNLVASLSAGGMRHPRNDLVLYGTTATLRCSASIGYGGGGRLELTSDQGIHATEFDKCDLYARQVDSFANSLRLETEPNASGYDGLRVVQVTSGIYEALRRRTWVSLTP